MTVAELIQALGEMPQDAVVVSWGMDENGYCYEDTAIIVGPIEEHIGRPDYPGAVCVIGEGI